MNICHENRQNIAFFQHTLRPFAEGFPLRSVLYVAIGNRTLVFSLNILQSKKLMILVNGRVENILKWTEPAWDFYHQGYDVLIMDHRGQGYSGRLLRDRQKGYIDEFAYYVEDLEAVINTVLQQQNYENIHLTAHSMGGLISAYYLAQKDHFVQKAVFSAPFWGILTAHPIRDALVLNLMILFGQGERYLFGHGAYQPKNPQDNDLSHSISRVQWQNEIIQQYPHLALGGATMRWVHLCWQAIENLPSVLKQIDIPVLVLQAEKDTIVNNNRLPQQIAFIPQSKHQIISSAKHELLFEEENIRATVFEKIAQFL